MNYEQVIQMLESDHFTRIKNQCTCFDPGAILYVKEISDHIFLVFVLTQGANIKNIRVVIAEFQCLENIGKDIPDQTLFYLSVKHEEDLHYFEKYWHFSNN